MRRDRRWRGQLRRLSTLFPARFFRRTYPEGQIVTMGSEDPFRRQVDTSEFRGTMMISNFPLIPRQQHWARLCQ